MDKFAYLFNSWTKNPTTAGHLKYYILDPEQPGRAHAVFVSLIPSWLCRYHDGRALHLQGLLASLMRLGSDVAGVSKASKKLSWRLGSAKLVASGHLA